MQKWLRNVPDHIRVCVPYCTLKFRDVYPPDTPHVLLRPAAKAACLRCPATDSKSPPSLWRGCARFPRPQSPRNRGGLGAAAKVASTVSTELANMRTHIELRALRLTKIRPRTQFGAPGPASENRGAVRTNARTSECLGGDAKCTDAHFAVANCGQANISGNHGCQKLMNYTISMCGELATRGPSQPFRKAAELPLKDTL